ncbi:MAG TPA: hypothetical protein VIU64_06545 [Polyangia bacterium]
MHKPDERGVPQPIVLYGRHKLMLQDLMHAEPKYKSMSEVLRSGLEAMHRERFGGAPPGMFGAAARRLDEVLPASPAPPPPQLKLAPPPPPASPLAKKMAKTLDDAQRLKNAMVGLTHAAAATEANVSKSTVTHTLAGHRPLTGNLLEWVVQREKTQVTDGAAQ